MEFSTLNEFFTASVERYHDLVAVQLATPRERHNYYETSYGELGELAGSFSGALGKLEVAQGDRVAILAKPRLEWQIALWGALRLGAVVIPIDADLTPPEIRRILEESEAQVLIAAGERLDSVKSALPATLEQRISMDRIEGCLNIWELLEGKEPPSTVEVKPEDLALIVYTSGTTGDAKGVMLSHYNLAFNVQAFLERLEVSSRDVVLSIIPWHHIFGFTATILGPIYRGATLIYTDDYKSLPQLMLRNRATILVGVPKLFHAMFQKIEERLTEGRLKERLAYRLLPRLAGRKLRESLTGRGFRFFVSGGAPLDPRTIRGFRRLGFGVIEGYGLTETAPVITFSTAFNRKAGSVGPPLPGVELKILHPNEERLGEVVVRGPNVMQGYYKNPERTREILDKDSWFHTGDLGRLDRDGWLYLSGRKKNVIILETGKNIYPEEVEFELGRIPYVEDILVQRGRRQGKEVVQALVYPNWALLKEEATDLVEIKGLLWGEISLRCRNLAPYKRIKSREDIIILSEPFEKTSSQDIKRYLYQQEKR
jgi:long-chain acyl-CoA synthetase